MINERMRRETLIDFFDDLGRASGEFLAYDNGFRRWTYTYSDVARAAGAFGARLDAAGIRKGDAAILWSENRPEWVVAFWGCLLQGVIAVPIDYRASADFLQRVAGIVHAKVVLVGDEIDHAALARAPGPPRWALTEIDWHSSATAPRATILRADTAEIIFTSGATAEPKGVVITHGNVLANIVPVEREILKYRKYARPFSPIRFLNLLPLSHLFGQSMATFVPPVLGGTVIFMRSYNPHDIVRQIKARRISVLVSVPKILDVLREHILRTSPDAATAPPPGEHFAWRWWRYRRVHRQLGLKFWSFVVGAAPLDPALEEFWSRLGFAVIQGYGLTETAPIVSLNHPFSARRGSVGKAIAGVDVQIAPDGEILVKGENVTKGYFGAADATAEAFADGWFHTGDIGEIDAQGRLYIKGRKKEMIVTPEGLNVFPEDVERAVTAVPGVKDVAVVGVRVGTEERVHAVVVTDPGIDPQGIVRTANLALLDHQKIRGISVWPSGELPRTEGTRKLKRREIREWVATGDVPKASTAHDATVADLVARFAGGRPVSSDTTIDELGLSSLERVELMVALEERFGTKIDESRFRRSGRPDRARAGRAAGRRALRGRRGARGFPGVEPGLAGARAAPCQPADLDPAARARLRLDPGRRSRAPARTRGPRHLRRQSPEPYRYAGDPLGAALAVAIPPGGGDGQGILQSAFFPARLPAQRAADQRPQLLPGLALLQRLPATAAGGWGARNTSLHWRSCERWVVGADFP